MADPGPDFATVLFHATALGSNITRPEMDLTITLLTNTENMVEVDGMGPWKTNLSSTNQKQEALHLHGFTSEPAGTSPIV